MASIQTIINSKGSSAFLMVFTKRLCVTGWVCVRVSEIKNNSPVYIYFPKACKCPKCTQITSKSDINHQPLKVGEIYKRAVE